MPEEQDNNREKGGKIKQKQKDFNYAILFEAGIEFALIIALPLIAGVYLGKWLDAKYQTNFIVIIGILLALGLSSYMIYKKTKELESRLPINKDKKK